LVSEGAIEWAAGRGFSILMDPHSSAPEIGRKRRFYAEKLAAGGFSEAGTSGAAAERRQEPDLLQRALGLCVQALWHLG
jgi:hypothetical protein